MNKTVIYLFAAFHLHFYASDISFTYFVQYLKTLCLHTRTSIYVWFFGLSYSHWHNSYKWKYIFKHKSTLHVHNMSHFKSVLLYRYLLWFCTYLAMKPNGMFFITEVECLIIYVHLKYILSYISMVLYKAVKPMFLINTKVECIFMSPIKFIYLHYYKPMFLITEVE